VANIFQLTQHNKDGSQKLIGQEISSGYELYIQQLINENKFLKDQNFQLLDKISLPSESVHTKKTKHKA
jgi:hypothetical protein